MTAARTAETVDMAEITATRQPPEEVSRESVQARIARAQAIEDPQSESQVLVDQILDLERTVAELKESENWFRSVVDRSPNAVAISEFSGRIVYANRTFTDSFVPPDRELLDSSLSDFLPEALSSSLEVLTREVIEGQCQVEREVEAKFADSTVHLVQSTKFPLFDTDGRAVGIVLICTDITSEREAEQRLRQAQKMDAIGQLTGGIAHDFNNLLMVIDGYARQALSKLSDPEIAEASVKEVIAGAERAANLTKQLLAFSRRQIMEKRVFSVGANLREIDGLLRRSVGELFELRFEICDDALCVLTDPGEFSQAILNLAVNARDAMPDGGSITVGLRELDQDERFTARFPDLKAGRYLEAFVKDNGHGIDEATLSRIFEPFFTTKEQGKGTGLGLAMVYGFAQQSGGTVEVASAPGEGTTVSIYLPVSDRPPDQISQEVENAWLGKQETVLLVEDDPKLLALTRYSLEELGYKVLVAENGFEALEMDEEHPDAIDLVLTDVVMPVMGGFELAELMRDARPKVKIVFMSGYPDRDKGDSAGDLPQTSQFLQKPFKINRLAQVLRNELDDDDVRLVC